jgi:alpha-galactosidase
MPTPKITMIGAGSGFLITVAKEIALAEPLQNSRFCVMDIDPERLGLAEGKARELLAGAPGVAVEATGDLAAALDGADYVVTSCETNRWAFWLQDLKIPEKYGVFQLMSENGGPGGIIHALRNMKLLGGIARQMERRCPRAWLMNFTNPMSFLCTYLNKYTAIRTLGFCHQVHGSFGVIAEQLGFEPGDLQVITGGVNHFNWLLDIRRRGSSESYLPEFLRRVRESEWWLAKHLNVPRQEFTLEVLKTFGAYPVGYDDHIVEYLPFFYEREEWAAHGYESREEALLQTLAEDKTQLKVNALQGHNSALYPFPKNNDHPYYAEKPTAVIQALETNQPLYLDALNLLNRGAIDNLPAEGVVDIPAVIVGGEARGVHVGPLPMGAMELCRRQITQHELIARAAAEGDASLVEQALCLDPYVRSITQARGIWKDYREEYGEWLPEMR